MLFSHTKYYPYLVLLANGIPTNTIEIEDQ